MAAPNKALQELGVVHRLCFAARSIPVDVPRYWELVRDFSIQDKSGYLLSADDCRVFVENLHLFGEDAFASDDMLKKRLIRLPKSNSMKSNTIKMILISPNGNCLLCNSKLYTRPDRHVLAVLYDHESGTIPAIHYTRSCRKKGCSFQQHYGYYTHGNSDNVTYNNDALLLPYFLCSRETGFSLALLSHCDSDLLIGQISYKQSAEIYNYQNNYEGEDHFEEQQAAYDW